MFYCCSKSFEYLNSPKFHFVKLRKLSVLCSKFTKNRKIKVPIRTFQNCSSNMPPKIQVMRYLIEAVFL